MEGCVKVSLYSEVKEIVSDVQKFGKDNIEVKKIVDLLKIVSFLIVCATFIVQYWKFMFGIKVEILPTFPIFLNQFLAEYTYVIFVGLIVYKVVGYTILRYLVISVEINSNMKLFPVLNTVEDIFEIGTLSILLLKLVNNLLLCIHGIDVIKSADKKIYIIYLICCFYLFVNWLYIKIKIIGILLILNIHRFLIVMARGLLRMIVSYIMGDYIVYIY